MSRWNHRAQCKFYSSKVGLMPHDRSRVYIFLGWETTLFFFLIDVGGTGKASHISFFGKVKNGFVNPVSWPARMHERTSDKGQQLELMKGTFLF